MQKTEERKRDQKNKSKLFAVVKCEKSPQVKNPKDWGHSFKRQVWTKIEEALFIEVHRKYGNKWALLAKKLRGK